MDRTWNGRTASEYQQQEGMASAHSQCDQPSERGWLKKKKMMMMMMMVMITTDQCFDADGWVTGRASGLKSIATTVPKSLYLGTSLTCSNSGKRAA